jgi:hypothetical protein
MSVRPYHIGIYNNFLPYSDLRDDGAQQGIFVDIWEKAKERHNIRAEEFYINDPAIGRDIDELQTRSKYDALIIPAFVSNDRIQKVNFTRPIMLNKIAIAFRPKRSMFATFFRILFGTVLPPILLLLCIGLVFGYALFLVEPRRGKARAIFSTIASLFGEMGFVSENSTLTYSGMFISFLIMFISFYFAIFLQAATIDQFSKSVTAYEVTPDNIAGKRIVTLKGSQYVKVLKQFGAEPVEHESIRAATEAYLGSLDGPRPYDGLLMDYETTQKVARRHDLVLTESNFGYNEIAFPVRKSNRRLLELLNETIVYLQDNNEMTGICRKHTDGDRAHYCDL